MKIEKSFEEGILAIPSLPVVLVTVGENIMSAVAFQFYSFDPYCLMLGVKPKNYTYSLISKKLEFGINIPTKDQIDVVRICGTTSGRTENKFIKAKVTPQKAKVIQSFLIKECPVNIECKVVHKIYYQGSHKWFIGEIKAVDIDENYSRDDALMYWANEFKSVGNFLSYRNQ